MGLESGTCIILSLILNQIDLLNLREISIFLLIFKGFHVFGFYMSIFIRFRRGPVSRKHRVFRTLHIFPVFFIISMCRSRRHKRHLVSGRLISLLLNILRFLRGIFTSSRLRIFLGGKERRGIRRFFKEFWMNRFVIGSFLWSYQ